MSDSYGDVTGEYFALRDDVGAVAGVHSLIWVRGKDAVSFLDGLLSQDIASMESGSVAKALLLTPQGKLRATLTLLRNDDAVGLVCDAGRVEVVLEDLARFKFRVAADIELFDGTVFDLIGPNAPAALEKAGFGPPDGWSRYEEVAVANVPLGSMARFVMAGAFDVNAVARMAGMLAFDAVRIERGEPVTGRDIDEKTIPQEADVVDASVSFTKGCYLGQELVARIDSRGRVNRHLRGRGERRTSARRVPGVRREVGWRSHQRGRVVGRQGADRSGFGPSRGGAWDQGGHRVGRWLRAGRGTCPPAR